MRIAVAGGSGVVGSYVVEAARAAGHEPVILSRSAGVDLRNDQQVVQALTGIDVVIDTVNSPSTNRKKATAFFTDIAHRLQPLAKARGVSRLVTLSIVGVDRVPGYGYYQAKLAQERAVLEGPVPATIVRATQFFEFPAQILRRTRFGPVALVPTMRLQPVAARSVAQVLLEAALAPELPYNLEIAGPEEMELTSMARMLIQRRGERLKVISFTLPGKTGRELRSGGNLPDSTARIVGPTFREWLATDDALSPPL